MVRRKKAKREAWFDLGVHAITHVLPPALITPAAYLCPLCYRWYPEVGQLTLEHVPPAGLGGRELILTCRQCNSTAGAMVDHEMMALEQALDFTRDPFAHPARGRLHVGEHTLRVNGEATGDDVQLTVVPKANRPDSAGHINEEIRRRRDEGRWEGSTLTFELDRGFRYRPALVGWLRAAYLVAFAAMGYRYVLHPNLLSVRRQLAEPTAAHLGIFSGIDSEAHPDARRLLLVNEPVPFRSLLVQMGRNLVFLPRREGEGDLYQRLAAELTPDRLYTTKFTGEPMHWPDEPTHAEDWPGTRVE